MGTVNGKLSFYQTLTAPRILRAFYAKRTATLANESSPRLGFGLNNNSAFNACLGMSNVYPTTA